MKYLALSFEIPPRLPEEDKPSHPAALANLRLEP